MFRSILTFLTSALQNLFHGRSSNDKTEGFADAVAHSDYNSNPVPSGYNRSEDLYSYYNNTGIDPLQSWANKQSESGLTGQQAALNEMSLDNQRRQYAFQTQGMLEAGLNPALMYQSGAMSAPSAPSPTQGMSMSELLQAILIGKQSDLMDAQIRNTDADTDKKKSETEQLNLINKYYPQVTETSLDKMLSEIGVNDERIKEIRGNVDLQELEKQLKASDIVIKQAEANESSAYFKAVRQYQEAATDKAKAEAAEAAVRAAMEELERNYMAHTNTKMGSATIVAIASALGTLFSDFHLDMGDAPTPGWYSASEEFKSWFNNFMQKFKDFHPFEDWKKREEEKYGLK